MKHLDSLVFQFGLGLGLEVTGLVHRCKKRLLRFLFVARFLRFFHVFFILPTFFIFKNVH